MIQNQPTNYQKLTQNRSHIDPKIVPKSTKNHPQIYLKSTQNRSKMETQNRPKMDPQKAKNGVLARDLIFSDLLIDFGSILRPLLDPLWFQKRS